MALTQKVEQRLEAVGLIKFFEDTRDVWLEDAKRAYKFISHAFPNGATIRSDDVAKALLPGLEVDRRLKKQLAKGPLTQNYWFSYFTDLVIDRTWDEIGGDGDDED